MISSDIIRNIVRTIYCKDEPLDAAKNPSLYALMQKAKNRMNSIDEDKWSLEEVAEDMATFSSHESLLADEDIVNNLDGDNTIIQAANEQRVSIIQGSEFVNYLQDHVGGDAASFNKMMYSIFRLLYIASNAEPHIRKTFFYNFPPMGDGDLECMAGSVSRFEDVFQAMKKKTPIEEVFYHCHGQVISVLTESVKSHFDSLENPDLESYHVHIPKYLEFLLGIRNVEQSLAIDSNYFLIASMIPVELKVKIVEFYSYQFNKNLDAIKLYPDFFLDLVDDSEIHGIIKDAISKVNESENAELGPKIPDDIDLFEIQFNSYLGSVTYNSAAPASATRISSVLSKVAKKTSYGVCFSQKAGREVEGVDDSYMLDMGMVQKGIAGLRKEGFDNELAFHEGRSANDRKTSIDITEFSLGDRIYDDAIITEIQVKLLSENVGDIKSAIDILYLLSEDISGSANLHFFNLMTEEIESLDVEGMLRDISDEEYGFNNLVEDREFALIYKERVNQVLKNFEDQQEMCARLLSMNLEVVDLQDKAVTDIDSRIDIIKNLSTQGLTHALQSRAIFEPMLSGHADLSLILMDHVSARPDKNRIFDVIIKGDSRLLNFCTQHLCSNFVEFILSNIEDYDYIEASNLNTICSIALEGGIAIDRFERIMELEGFDVGFEDRFGDGYLHNAASFGRPDVVERLLALDSDEFDIDKESFEGKTALGVLLSKDPLKLTSDDMQIANLLVSKGANIDHIEGGAQQLLHCIISANDEEVDFAAKSNLIFKIFSGDDLVVIDCVNGDDPLESLMYVYSPLNECDSEESTHIHVAALLVNAGSDISEVICSTEATTKQKKDLIECLVEVGFDLNKKDSRGSSAIIAALNGQVEPDQSLELIRLLLGHEADPCITLENDGSTHPALLLSGMCNKDFASEGQRELILQTFKELIRAGAYLNKEIYDEIDNLDPDNEGEICHVGLDFVKEVVEKVNQVNSVDVTEGQLVDLLKLSCQEYEESESLIAKSVLIFRDEGGRPIITTIVNDLCESDFNSISQELKGALSTFIETHSRILDDEFLSDYKQLSAGYEDANRALQVGGGSSSSGYGSSESVAGSSPRSDNSRDSGGLSDTSPSDDSQAGALGSESSEGFDEVAAGSESYELSLQGSKRRRISTANPSDVESQPGSDPSRAEGSKAGDALGPCSGRE